MITANISVEDCKSTRRASHYQFQSGGTDGSADQPAVQSIHWRGAICASIVAKVSFFDRLVAHHDVSRC
jgi:hypothetical protein